MNYVHISTRKHPAKRAVLTALDVCIELCRRMKRLLFSTISLNVRNKVKAALARTQGRLTEVKKKSSTFPFIHIQPAEQQVYAGRPASGAQVSVCNIVRAEFKGTKVCDESFNWS